MNNLHNYNNNNPKKKNSSSSKSSWKYISSCLKTATATVRAAGASVANSIVAQSQSNKDQVLWASFDKLELSSSESRHVLLLGYTNGFQVIDIQDASNVSELVSKRDNPVTFLQMQPIPKKSNGEDGFGPSHPLLLVVASDETKGVGIVDSVKDGHVRNGYSQLQTSSSNSPTAVRFYSLKSHSYVHVLRFRSAVYMVRCSTRVVAVGLASQIYCFDALTYENKFSVLTYPLPQIGGTSLNGINVGYGPMAVGPRWLAFASNSPLPPNMSRLSPQNQMASPCTNPSSSLDNGNLVARYAVESSKQLANGLMNLGDMGYKTLSKYYQELLPDGSSSPVQSNIRGKASRVGPHSPVSDIAGTVVIKDVVSKAVVSQFKAHTSPVSALCFDPTGTLLVTASIYGNNINIFRIMPLNVQNGSDSHCYDWSSNHVHLYKLHRGITSAVIQDFCFSQYSQWIAIITSKGTCHIYVLSPFGGDSELQKLNSHHPSLPPILSHPWWSTTSFKTKQQSLPHSPPPPVTLSVVSRIKYNNYGWLNTVSNPSATASGKVSIPSGALTAVFHCCLSPNSPSIHTKRSSLEHILAYTPSGLVAQYKLVPSKEIEQSETTRPGSGSVMHLHEEELKVKAEPVQWWDVCRRMDWPDMEESLSEIPIRLGVTSSTASLTSEFGANGTLEEDCMKFHDSHLYISKAEVNISSLRVPIWQNLKISFSMINLPGVKEHHSNLLSTGGEIEVEKMLTNEVEKRKEEPMPLFDPFHHGQSGSADSVNFSKSLHGIRVGNNNHVLDQKQGALSNQSDFETTNRSIKTQIASETAGSVQFGSSIRPDNFILPKESHVYSSPVKSNLSSNIVLLSGGRNSSIEDDATNSSINSQCFREEYCTVSALDGSHPSADIIANVVNSPSNMEKSEEEDENNEDMLGALFAFPDEG